VVFDWAGTLVDFGSRAPIETLRAVFAEKGLTVSDQELRRDMGKQKRDHIRSILEQPRLQAAWEGQSEPWTEAVLDELFQRAGELFPRFIKDQSALIPGVLSLFLELRSSGVSIGSCTGYARSQMEILLPLARSQGFEPDHCVVPEDCRAGRPEPWMVYRNAELAGVYPRQKWVKVGDTPADIKEGRNAGAWTVAYSLCGNGLGMDLGSYEDLTKRDAEKAHERIKEEFKDAGAHYVVPGPWALDRVLDRIDQKISEGKKP